MTASIHIPVGVVVERRKAIGPWADFIWQPMAVLPDTPDLEPWTALQHENDRTSFYAGSAIIELHSSETSNYRDNLAAGGRLWVVLRATDAATSHEIVRVTADPYEGEGYTQAGDDLVEAVPMPETIRATLAAFIAEHHVERAFFKRKRDRANPGALDRRTRSGEGDR